MNSTKEFYFLRHGQTDFNVHPDKISLDHPKETPLNKKGQIQAFKIALLVQKLPIHSIYTSPMKRVEETFDILFLGKERQKEIVTEFDECDSQTWREMIGFQIKSSPQVSAFIYRIKLGLEKVLSNSVPSLVIAHGGTHWAFCYLLGIKQHDWLIDNCKLVRFYASSNESWAVDNEMIFSN